MLDRLPTELLCMITEYLAVDAEDGEIGDDRSLDLISMRSVCRTVAAGISDIFARAYFTTVTVAMTRRSFEKLSDISRHASFRPLVRSINFFTDGLPDDAHMWNRDRLRRFRSWDKDDQDFIRNQDRNCAVLASTLSNLENVRGVFFRGFHKSVRSCCFEKHCWNSFHRRSCSAVRAIQLVIRAVAASGTEIDEFEVSSWYGFDEEEVVTPIWAFDFDSPYTITNPLSPAFRSLKILGLDLLCDIENLETPLHWTNDRAVQCLIGLLSKTVNLNMLTLTLDWEDTDPWPGSQLIRSFDLRNLSTLRLVDFLFDKGSLVVMLMNHANVLRNLSLCLVTLISGTWSSAFMRLQERLLLEKLALEALREDYKAILFSEDLKGVPDKDPLSDRYWEGVEQTRAAMHQIAKGDSYVLEEED